MPQGRLAPPCVTDSILLAPVGQNWTNEATTRNVAPTRNPHPIGHREMLRNLLGVFNLYLLKSTATAHPAPDAFLRSANVSFLDEFESAGAAYTDNGLPMDALEILGSRGLNAVRLRAFNSPDVLQNSSDDMLREPVP